MKFLPLLLALFFIGCGAKAESSYLEVQGPAGEARVDCTEDRCSVDRITNESFLNPVAPETACTRIYGGPEKIFLRGVANGKIFQAEFNRVGGCEIERFDEAVRFLEEIGISRNEILQPRES